LMGQLLKVGDAPFMLVKLLVGAFAAYTLYRCSHLPLARRGMRLVLTIYVALMPVHAATGMSALGWSQPLAAVNYMTNLPYALLTRCSWVSGQPSFSAPSPTVGFLPIRSFQFPGTCVTVRAFCNCRLRNRKLR